MGTMQQIGVVVGAVAAALVAVDRFAAKSLLRTRLTHDVALWDKLDGDQRGLLREIIDVQVMRLWLLEQPDARLRWMRVCAGLGLAAVGLFGTLTSPVPHDANGWALVIMGIAEAVSGVILLIAELRRWHRARTPRGTTVKAPPAEAVASTESLDVSAE